jgi:hypothetical protein
VDSNLFVTSDTESTDGVTGLACGAILLALIDRINPGKWLLGFAYCRQESDQTAARAPWRHGSVCILSSRMGLLTFLDAIVADFVDGYRCFVQVRKLTDGRVTNFVSLGNFEGLSALKRGGQKNGSNLAYIGLAPKDTLRLYLQPAFSVRLRKFWRWDTILTLSACQEVSCSHCGRKRAPQTAPNFLKL